MNYFKTRNFLNFVKSKSSVSQIKSNYLARYRTNSFNKLHSIQFSTVQLLTNNQNISEMMTSLNQSNSLELKNKELNLEGLDLNGKLLLK